MAGTRRIFMRLVTSEVSSYRFPRAWQEMFRSSAATLTITNPQMRKVRRPGPAMKTVGFGITLVMLRSNVSTSMPTVRSACGWEYSLSLQGGMQAMD